MKTLNYQILHLYFECDAVLDGKKCYIHSIDGLGVVTVKFPGGGFESFVLNDPLEPREFKLILRKLSSMTEEEAIELNWRMKYFQSEDNFPKPITFLPNEFTYLLSKSFDLFNLIEDGLAIDRDSLTNDKQ